MNAIELLSDLSIIKEETSQKQQRHLQMSLLDVDDFVKKNDVKEITDPVFFIKDGVPSSEGLLSNEIFGITKEERSNIYGYIDLGGWFIHPLIYKKWSRADSRIREIVHGTNTYSLDENGYIIEDPKGKTGVSFLKNNIDKIRIKSTESIKREKIIEFINANKKVMFMNKELVIPAYYRDANTTRGNIGVGQLNKYYSSLLIAIKAIKETQDYGLSLENSTAGRIQELILDVYNCLCGTSNNKDDGVGISKKRGFLKQAVMSKTADDGTRLILSAPELKVESLDDMMVDIDHAALPLASAITNYKEFVIYYIKRFFENEFGGGVKQKFINEKGEIEYVDVKDPLIQFSDDVINRQINKYTHGWANRFEPISVELEGGRKVFMAFKGHNVTPEMMKNKDIIGESPLINRRLTWCDILYIAAEEAAKDKMILVTRYPIDSYYNQVPMKCRISTTKQTEKVKLNSSYYPFYPKIREKDIGTNTSNKFIDTLMFSNVYLKGFCGDYDGDTASIKAAWTTEANDELKAFVNSKSHLIDLGGINIRVSTNEAIQSLYCLTKVLPQDVNKLTDPVF